MKPKYRWSTLGVGVIGHRLAEAMQKLGGNLYSVGNRTQSKAVAFADKFGIEKVCAAPDEIFSDPDVDIVYISTPHNTHINYLRRALAAGKHVLCEKSITLNSTELNKRGTIAFDKGYVEIFEYPRSSSATIVWTDGNRREELTAGDTADALCYEIEDMEAAVSGERNDMHLDYTIDVMNIMTKLRNDWNMTYPEEE